MIQGFSKAGKIKFLFRDNSRGHKRNIAPVSPLTLHCRGRILLILQKYAIQDTVQTLQASISESVDLKMKKF